MPECRKVGLTFVFSIGNRVYAEIVFCGHHHDVISEYLASFAVVPFDIRLPLSAQSSPRILFSCTTCTCSDQFLYARHNNDQ